MRLPELLAVAVVLGAVAGCQEPAAPPLTPETRAEANSLINRSIRDAAVHNAIIRQHTVYPYHFVAGGNELNDLGRREVNVLAEHYKKYPGQVNVRRADTPKPLYEARVYTVVAALKQGGVDVDVVRIGDDLPGGDGMTAELVLQIIEGRNSPSTPAYNQESGRSRSGSGSSSLSR